MIQRPRLALGVLFAALCAVTAVWVSVDRRPPPWDHANHLERAIDCYRILSEPGHHRFREIMAATAFYPPIVPCSAGVLYFVFPMAPLTAQAVMLAYLALALAAIFALGSRLWDPGAGLLAALVLGTAPFVVFSLMNFQLDLPLMAMVTVALYALVRTEQFSHPGWTMALGFVLALGMVTKPPFAVYLLPPLLAAAWLALRAPDRRRRLGWLGLSLLIAAALVLPWYGPRLLGLPMQISNRSFKQAAESGYPEALTVEGLLFYPRVLAMQFGILAAPLFGWGIFALRKDRRARAFLWLASLVPFVVFSLIQNKNLRYTLPILPAASLVAVAGIRALTPAWRRRLAGLCLAAGALQVSMTAFATPKPPSVPWLGVPLVVSLPPSRADWQHDRVLADLVRETGGAEAKVAVVPNYNFFSVSTFRYETARRRLPFEMLRPWSDAPVGVDYVILKTGSLGPSFSVAKAERITKAFEGGDPYLNEIFPVVAEYPLPDGSRGILRARHISPLAGVTASSVAERLQASPAQLLAANIRDPVGLRVHVDYRPEALLRGEANRVTLEADAVVIGELKRRDRAPLRVREAALEVDGLLFNPRRLLETGQLEVLDVKALRVRHLVITEDDLREFLRGQPVGDLRVRLDEGAADVRVSRLGPLISARVRLISPAAERVFALAADRVRIGPLLVPDLFTDWIVRQFDPTPALRRLPVRVELGPIRMKVGRIEIGP